MRLSDRSFFQKRPADIQDFRGEYMPSRRNKAWRSSSAVSTLNEVTVIRNLREESPIMLNGARLHRRYMTRCSAFSLASARTIHSKILHGSQAEPETSSGTVRSWKDSTDLLKRCGRLRTTPMWPTPFRKRGL